MLISVIVPVYNIEKYIARCIESLINQTYKDLEIILVDDGSTNSAGEICDEYAKKDARIKVIHRINGGLSTARNTGIAAATGEYIAFVDGDDWVEDTMYEEMAELAKEQQADLVVCRYRCIYKNHQTDGSTGRVTVFEKPLSMLKQYLKEDEAFLIQHAAWNKLYHRNLLGDERFPEGKWYEDVVFSAKILSRIRKGIYLDHALYNYVCEREDSIMNAGMTERIFTDLIPAYLEKETFLEELEDKEPVCIHRYYFYKRLLLFYRDVHKKENRALQKYKKYLVQLVKERRHTFQDVYKTDVAAKTEEIKTKLFVFSPLCFRMFMAINDKFILPRRLKRMEKKK
ncbi:MAG: glycosyltransferase [Lachnospiraceae bacterium]|nr:glycosyltransferase [Lachnospiraceae bacterium]